MLLNGNMKKCTNMYKNFFVYKLRILENSASHKKSGLLFYPDKNLFFRSIWKEFRDNIIMRMLLKTSYHSLYA